MTVYREVMEEKGADLSSCADLERSMWAKIMGEHMPKGNKLPWALVKKNIKVLLPYMPDIINYNNGCQGLKKADGLYIPCGGKCEAETVLCAPCTKVGAKYGTIEDRTAPGTYMDPEDKHEITYGTWLAKKEKTIEEVNEAIQEAGFDFTIPASYLAVNAKRVEAKHRPGRPKAKKEVSESDSESESESEPKAPKKAAKKKSESEDESEPKAKKAAKKKSEDSESESEPKVKKAAKKKSEDSEDESEPKVKKAAKKKSEDSEDESEPKVKKATKKKSEDSEDESEPKVKKATKAKSESESEPKAPKVKKAAKKTKSDSESESDEPKAPKVKKATKKAKSDDESEPKAKKVTKKTKSDAPKSVYGKESNLKNCACGDTGTIGGKCISCGVMRNLPCEQVPVKSEPSELQLDAEGFEVEDEEIEIDGQKFKLRDGRMVFNMDGEWVACIEEGEVNWRE
jgi:hypothetical protein